MYAFVSIFRPQPVGHGCPIPGYSCVYHPLIGEGGPWVILGLLAGLWLAYAVAGHLARSQREDLHWIECAIVLPALIAVILWALVIGPQQAGGAYVRLFLLAVALTALLRLVLAAPTTKHAVSRLVTKLGIVNRPTAAA